MISVVIPLFNKQNSIAKTLESVLKQDYCDFEIIVVDDGSTDGSKTVVEGIVDERIHLSIKSNGGPASARNYGVEKSHGNWILFLDADDYLEPGALSHFAALIGRYPGCCFFCANHYVELKGNKQLYSDKYKEGYLKNSFFAWCTNSFMPRAGAALFSKSLLEKYSMREDLRRYEDAEHLFTLMRKTRIVQSPVPVMTYRCDMAEASYSR